MFYLSLDLSTIVPSNLRQRVIVRFFLTPARHCLRFWTRDFSRTCLLYTSDAADDLLCVDLGGRRIIKKKKKNKKKKKTNKHTR